jgi:site-specific recombinase XerC
MPERMPLPSAIASFLLDSQIVVGKSTLYNYRHNLDLFVGFLAGLAIEFLGDIKPDHVRAFYLWRQAGKSQHTLHQSARVVRTFLRWCVRQELISSNPGDKVRFPRWPKAEPRGLMVAQVMKLMAYAESTWQPERDKALFYVLLDCGLRRGEAAGLAVNDLDFEAKRLTVRHGKWDSGRVVPISDYGVFVLRAWVAICPNPNLLFGLKPEGVYQVMVRASRSVGFKVCPHQLRHTFASLYRGDLKDCSRILGHRDVSTTAMIYAHRDISTLVDAHNQVGLSRYMSGGAL